MRLLCAWCSQFFDWEPPFPGADQPRYCKKKHKNAASMASRRFVSNFREGHCPTPNKRAFDTALAAQRWMKVFPEGSGGCRSYRCSCKKFHIGHVKRGF